MNIVPTPKKITINNDKIDYLAFAPSIKNNDEFSNAIDSFVIYAERIYGIAITKEEDAPMQVIYETKLASEEYRLVVNEEGAIIYASDLLGAGFKVINCSWIPTYVVTPLQMWSPKEVFDWSVYSWRAKAIKSPIHKTGYESPKTSQILGGQLLAWGDHISTKCPSVEEGVYEERNRMLERLPMTAENTWNIEKVTDYDSFEKTITVPQEKLFKMIGNTRRDISCI